jgi:MSHA biogenesis protein MshL
VSRAATVPNPNANGNKGKVKVKNIISIIMVLVLAGCSSIASKKLDTYDLINAEIGKAAEGSARPTQPAAVEAALLPSLQVEMPKARKPMQERFNVAFNNVPAPQFFMAIVSGTPYNMLVHPDVVGTISANLKDVTLFEALDAIRELYGYDYKVEGTRIVIKPLTLQTGMFQINYLTGSRKGTSNTRVSSGSVSDVPPSISGVPVTGVANPNAPTGVTQRSLESTQINTTSTTGFWDELKAALDVIVGVGKDGRTVVISPQSGVVVIRAMAEELRSVAAYLKATQLSVDRQVILEAKILEVQLNDSYQSGINWASFASFSGNLTNRVSGGFLSPGTTLSSAAQSNTLATTTGNNAISAVTSLAITTPTSAPASLFGLAVQTNNFASLITFLETQGTVHVLSSPRIATLNNQKAILKVGTDEFFVTNVNTTAGTTVGNNSTQPVASVTVQPFFSGVVLDVTPQIDVDGNIILHVHPSVTSVTTDNKVIDLGATLGTYKLPLALSATSETDSVVRGKDGQVVAIGGLMRQATISDNSQLPGAGNLPVVGALFRNTNQVMQKRELVILIKPTVVQGNGNWTQDMLESQRRIQTLEPPSTDSQRLWNK